jgi:hypothetical protein
MGSGVLQRLCGSSCCPDSDGLDNALCFDALTRLGGHVVPWCESHKPGLEGKGFPPLVVVVRLGAFGAAPAFSAQPPWVSW